MIKRKGCEYNISSLCTRFPHALFSPFRSGNFSGKIAAAIFPSIRKMKGKSENDCGNFKQQKKIMRQEVARPPFNAERELEKNRDAKEAKTRKAIKSFFPRATLKAN